MEYAILFAALLAGAAVMFLKGLWDQHRAQKWNREQLRKSFGKAGRTEYADGELNGIVRYFEKHPKDFQIDRKSTRLNSSHDQRSRMPSSA